jgi:hypothetical protein
MGALRNERFMPALLPMLGASVTRRSAREALLAFGPAGLEFLSESLSDTTLPQEIRRHVPRTMANFPGQDAGPILLRHYLAEQNGMVRFKVLRGLGHIAARNPSVGFDPKVLELATERTLEAAFRLVHWRQVLAAGVLEVPRRATPGHELLADLLRDKEAQAIERLFRLIGLQYRAEDFERIYRGLHNMNPKIRSGSRELLENLLRPPLRGAVLALVDDTKGADRLAAASPRFTYESLTYEALLTRLIEQPSETLMCLAAYHVGELGLATLKGPIEARRTHETGLFAGRILERTLRQIMGASAPGFAHAG